MGFVSSSKLNFFSKHNNQIKNYSNFQFNSTLNPWFVTGFTDGEGSFILTIIKDKKYKLGWRVVCRFIISLNKKDLKLLQKIQGFLGQVQSRYWETILFSIE